MIPSRPGLILAAVLVLFASPAAADSLTYHNDRFGTEITFPAELFETRLEPPANGDGMRWQSPDGGTLAAFGFYSTDRQSPRQFLDWLTSTRDYGDEVTYRRTGDNWAVLSGTSGEMIYYERYVFGGEDIVHGMRLEYPSATKGVYNPLVGPIANSLRGP